MLKKFISLIVICFVAVILTSTVVFADAKKGEKIFNNKKKGNCKTCHNLTAKKKVGPGLKGMFDRYSEDWLKKWIKDPQGTWTVNEPETLKMKKRLKKENKKKTIMKLPRGVELTDEQLNDLIDYLKGAAK